MGASRSGRGAATFTSRSPSLFRSTVPGMSEETPEAQDGSGPVKNYAAGNTDAAVRLRERIKTEIVPMAETIRQARLPLEEQWARYEKAWTMEHELQSYLGRSNIYMPVTNKQVE